MTGGKLIRILNHGSAESVSNVQPRISGNSRHMHAKCSHSNGKKVHHFRLIFDGWRNFTLSSSEIANKGMQAASSQWVPRVANGCLSLGYIFLRGFARKWKLISGTQTMWSWSYFPNSNKNNYVKFQSCLIVDTGLRISGCCCSGLIAGAKILLLFFLNQILLDTSCMLKLFLQSNLNTQINRSFQNESWVTGSGFAYAL